MNDRPGLAEFEAHLAALRTMPLSVAEAMREKLLEQREWIDGQLTIVNQVIERQSNNGVGEGLPASPVATGERLFSASGPPQGKSRRITLLTILAERPDRGWTQKDMKQRLVTVGSVTDDSDGTKRTHSTVAQLKKREEIEQLGFSRYRITPKGLAAIGK